MKNRDQLKFSASASIKWARRDSRTITALLAELAAGGSLELVMPALRNRLAELNKNVHEYNAYRNALDT